MGQDGEAAAELVATIRGEHVVMKTWFMGHSPEAKALREKYGPYPGLWKEVLNWPGWKESRKTFLAHYQKEEPGVDAAAVPRKRRSRWGTNAAESTNNNNNDTCGSNGGEQPPPNKQRRSRWGRDQPAPAPATTPATAIAAPLPGIGAVAALPGLPGMPTNLPPQEQEKMRTLQSRLRTINETLENLDAEAARVDALPRGHRERSPSPPPVYGVDGKRKNTRAVRWRERYSAERHDILEEIMQMNPAARKSGLFKRKRTNKIRIPIEQHPTYNFIGLIIGPRGKTQKDLEAKTGCKIAIRGRGSVKVGARGRRDGKLIEGENDPLHVVITGDDQKSVDAATDMINQMLVVIDDERNVHKQNQLRELALLNGTLKEDEFCQICAEKGHRSFECPKRFSMNKNSVSVKCAICGDTSHPTRDCTRKGASKADQANPQELDSDYAAFMNELDGKKAEKAPAVAIDSAPPPPNAGSALGALLPPTASAPAAAAGISIGKPPPPPGTAILPPPPTGGPPPLPPPHMAGQQPNNNYYSRGAPPPPSNIHYAGQQPRHPYHAGGQPPLRPYPPPPGGQFGQPPPGQYGQSVPPPPPNHHQQAQPGEETKAWDARSYYGSGAGGDAGGFNWWG